MGLFDGVGPDLDTKFCRQEAELVEARRHWGRSSSIYRVVVRGSYQCGKLSRNMIIQSTVSNAMCQEV